MDAIYFVDFKKSNPFPGGNYFSIKECFLVLLELTNKLEMCGVRGSGCCECEMSLNACYKLDNKLAASEQREKGKLQVPEINQ